MRGSSARHHADVPINRVCRCDVPVIQRDEDDEASCFRCGRPLDKVKAKAAGS